MTTLFDTASTAAFVSSLAFCVTVSGSIAQAQKEPALIRQHVMDQVVVSSEPDHDPALVEVLQTTV